MAKEIKRVVGQSNNLVRNVLYKNLSINDLKVFKTIISKVNYRESLFEDFYPINYKELDLAGVGRKNRFERVNLILEKLASTYVYLKADNGKTRKLGLIANDFIYDERTAYIEVRIHEKLKDELLQLKELYTKYQLEDISKFKNVYTLKLFELFKSFEGRKTFDMTVDNLRKFLEIEDDEYPMYGNFKQRVLNSAINTINKNTDINVSFEEIKKTGRKVESLKFSIGKDGFKSKEREIEFDLTEFIDKVIVDKKGKKFLIREYVKGKKIGFYNLKMLNLESYKEVTLPTDMKKSELYEIVKGRIDITELIKQKNRNKKKIENATKSLSNEIKDLADSKKTQSRLSGLTQQERINKFKNEN